MRRGIFATRQELTRLRDRVSHRPFDVFYQRLRTRCSLILESSPVGEPQWRAMWEQGVWGAAVRAARIAQGRMWDLLIAHHIEPNRAYRDRAIEELKTLIRWSAWVDPCYSPLSADLCTAEAVTAAVVALDWLWEDITEADRIRVLQAIRRKAIEPYRQAVREGAWWYGCYHCWNAVVNAGCGIAGLTLGDDEPDASEVVNLAQTGLRRFFDALGREGGWDEGIGYWGYALRYISLFGEASARLVGDVRIFHTRGMDATGMFPLYFTPHGQPVTFGDDFLSPLYGALYVLVARHGMRELAWWLDTFQFHHDVSTTDLAAAGLSLLLRPADLEQVAPPEMSPVRVFHEVGWAAMADCWPAPGLYAAAKTGDLAANHSQRDMNSVQVQVDGELLLTDLGPAPFSRAYFADGDEGRASFYEVQAKAHNTVTIADRDHRIDAQGRVIEAQADQLYRWVACDAGTACGQSVRFIRHVVLLMDPAGRQGRSVVVLDELASGTPETVRQYWHTTGKWEFDAARGTGKVIGARASLYFALGGTLKATGKTASLEVRQGRNDQVLEVSAGLAGRGLLLTVFSRQPIDGKLDVKASSAGVTVRVGGATLHFKSLKRSLLLADVEVR